MSRSPLEYLRHMLDEIAYLERESVGLTGEQFFLNETLKRSFVRSLEIIGEASKNVPEEFRNRYSWVDWKKAAGLRDRLIHGYFGVDYAIVWDVITNRLPVLKEQITEILDENFR